MLLWGKVPVGSHAQTKARWVSASFSSYLRMCLIGCTLGIKNPLIKGNSLFPITFNIVCNYCKYWLRGREFSFFPVQV